MSDLAETKKKMAQAIKSHFQELKVPGEVSKKVSTKMRLEAKLKSGADLAIGCAEVKGGRLPGFYGLYWMFSMTGGPIHDIMTATALDADPHSARPYVITCTSHNLSSASHFEVGPNTDFDGVAAAICKDIREQAFPIISGFESEPNRALDYILSGIPFAVRNPFTTSIILMHLAKRTDRLDEIINVASAREGFYDFKGKTEARANIIEPLAKWFAARA